MAEEFPRVITPRLPRTLSALWFYLADRDVGPPSIRPAPGEIDAGDGVDVLHWSFADEALPGDSNYRRADGFLVAAAAGDTAEPWMTGSVFRVSAQARHHVMPGWPEAQARSYALAAFRSTWQGEQATAFVQPDAWRNVTG